jgi:hypothetical protein
MKLRGVLAGLLVLFIFILGCAQQRCPHCRRSYNVKKVPSNSITVDGKLNDHGWCDAKTDTHFVFPWEPQRKVPLTVFHAVHDGQRLYLSWRAVDEEIVLAAESDTDEKGIIGEDRCEIYFTPEFNLSREYYSFEINLYGKVLDYAISYHRNFNMDWKYAQIVAAGAKTADGYIVEASLPLAFFEEYHLWDPIEHNMVKAGLFRSQFNLKSDGSIEEHWLSWLDPKRTEIDFHMPGTFGCFYFE